jgi:hypothetical protein
VAEVIVLDVHADDVVVDLLVLGEADGLAAQALDMSAEVEVSALNPPGALLADPVQVLLRQQPGVGAPLVGVADTDGQVAHLCQQLLEGLVLPTAIVPGQDQPALPLDQIPGPALAGLRADKGPELVPLGGLADLHLQRAETLGLCPVDEEGVNLGQAFF